MPKTTGEHVSDNRALAAQWHSTKNGALLPSQVALRSNKKRWWQCPNFEDHAWRLSPGNMMKIETGCAKCGGRIADPGRTDVGTVNPALAAELHPTLNGSVTARDILPFSNLKRWWQCPNFEDHAWRATPNNRSQGRGCGKCGGRIVDPGRTDLGTLDPILALDWDYDANEGKTPRDVMVSAKYRAGWKCHLCSHTWRQTVNARHNGNGCPACANQVLLPEKNSLLAGHPEIAAELHPTKNKGVTADQIRRGTDDKYWWYRKECDHEWYAAVNSRTESSKMAGCAVCSGSQIQIGKNDLGTTEPALAAELHPTLNNGVTAQMITSGSGIPRWWTCPHGHDPYEMAPYSRKAGRGCPKCALWAMVSKAENALAAALAPSGLTFERSVRKVVPGMEIDIFMPELRVGIEFNGVYWHSDQRGKNAEYHRSKWSRAKAVGITLLQVWEDNWSANPDLVTRLLLARLRELNPASDAVIGLMQAADLRIVPVGVKAAKEFLQRHDLGKPVAGAQRFGLRDGTRQLRAVLVVEVDQAGDAHMLRYADDGMIAGGFGVLLDHMIAALNPRTVTAVSDNCLPHDALFAAHGFAVAGTVEPDYAYVVNGKRYAVTDRSIWQRKDVTMLPKVWDAGGSHWIKLTAA